MDRRERLALDIEDKWSPALEKMGEITDKLKKSYESFTVKAMVGHGALWALGRAGLKAAESLSKLLSKLYPMGGVGLTIAAVSGAVKGYGEGMKRVFGIIGAGVGAAVNLFNMLKPVVVGVGGALLGFGGIADRAFDWVKNNPASRFFVGMAKDLINVAMATEVLKNRLVTVFGSFEAGNTAFSRFTELASKTPYLIEQVVSAASTIGSFDIANKAEDMGKMERYVTEVGDSAAATGKDVNDLAYAFANATVGQMRGLKQIGITSAMIRRKLGQDIDVETELGREQTAEAVASLMHDKFTGGMGRMMSLTMTGLLSNMKDFVSQTKRIMGADLGSVVLRGMRGVSKYIEGFKKSGDWEFIAKQIGNAFTVVGVAIEQTIVPQLENIGAAIKGVVSDSRWMEFWDAIAAVVRSLADVYVKDLIDKIQRIPSILGTAVPFLQKMPVYVEFLYEKFENLKNMTFQWVQGLAGGVGKISFQGIIQGVGKMVGWLFKALEYWHTIKLAVIGIGGVIATFMIAPLAGPLAPLVVALGLFLTVSAASKEYGMAKAFRQAATAAESLAAGFRPFVQWIQNSINGLIKMANYMKYVGSLASVIIITLTKPVTTGISAEELASKTAEIAKLSQDEGKYNQSPVMYAKQIEQLKKLRGWQQKYNDEVAAGRDPSQSWAAAVGKAWKDVGEAGAHALDEGNVDLMSGYNDLAKRVANRQLTTAEQIGATAGEAMQKSVSYGDVMTNLRQFQADITQAQINASVSTKDAMGETRKELEKAHKQVADITTLYTAQAATMGALNEAAKGRAGSEGELYTLSANQTAMIEQQMSALGDEYNAYKALAEVQEGGLTLENKTHLLELSQKSAALDQQQLQALAGQRDLHLEMLSQYSALYAEQASGYGDESRYMGAKSAALSNQLNLEQQRLGTIQNILRYEKLGIMDRQKYNLEAEKSRSKIKALNDEMRGNRDEDWVAQVLGNVRGLENVSPTMGSMKYIASRSETPKTAFLTVAVEDRRDLQTVLQDKVLPMIDRKLFDESTTDANSYGGYR